MPDLVSDFGEFRLDDDAGLERWLLAHDLRHAFYASHFKLKGVPLVGPVNADWMLRHALQHQVLASVARDRNANIPALEIQGMWRTDEELATWQLPHGLMHQRIEGVIAHGR